MGSGRESEEMLPSPVPAMCGDVSRHSIIELSVTTLLHATFATTAYHCVRFGHWYMSRVRLGGTI